MSQSKQHKRRSTATQLARERLLLETLKAYPRLSIVQLAKMINAPWSTTKASLVYLIKSGQVSMSTLGSAISDTYELTNKDFAPVLRTLKDL